MDFINTVLDMGKVVDRDIQMSYRYGLYNTVLDMDKVIDRVLLHTDELKIWII